MSDLPNKLKKIFEEIFSKGNFEEKLGDLENKSAFETIITLFDLGLSILQDRDGLIASLEYYKHIVLNFEEKLIESHIVDGELYKDIKENVRKALQKDSAEVKRIYLDYKKSLKSKYPLKNLTSSLLFYQKFLPELFNLATNTPMLDFRNKSSIFFMKMLEESGEQESDRYIFDWLLKFGYLIEGFVIDVLRAELQFHYLLNDIKYSKEKIMKLRFFDLINKLKGDHIFRKYRNAIFHTSFVIKYDVDLKARKIIFPSLKGNKNELTIERFIEYYFRLIQVVQSYRYAYTYAVPLDMREDGQKQLIEILDDAVKSLDRPDMKSTN